MKGKAFSIMAGVFIFCAIGLALSGSLKYALIALCAAQIAGWIADKLDRPR